MLIRIETKSGHGASSLSKQIEETADVFAFVFAQMGVEVKFKNKTNVVRAKLLIGADGMNSAIGRQMTMEQGGKEEKAMYSGLVKWESIIPSSLTKWELVSEGCIKQITGPDFVGRLVNLGNNKIYWQVSVDCHPST